MLEQAQKAVMDRLKNIDFFDETFVDQQKDNVWYKLGPLQWLTWIVTIVTGAVLVAFYIPTAEQAYDSIINIQENIPFGDLIRGMHKYGADAFIIMCTLKMYRMFICADYKGNRELNLWICFFLLLLGFYSGLSGYLLIWNQRAFWATKVFATFPGYMDQFGLNLAFMGSTVVDKLIEWGVPTNLPAVPTAEGGGVLWDMQLLNQYVNLNLGMVTQQILLGGSAIGQATITRFYSMHMALSTIGLIIVELYFYSNKKKRFNLPWREGFLVIFMIAAAAIIFPAEMGGRANPSVTPLPILSDWYFLALYQMYKYIEPVLATFITMLIPATVLVLPFLDRSKEKSIVKRPLIMWTTIMGAISTIAFSVLIILNIANINTDPPYWVAGTTILLAIGLYFSQKQYAGIDRWRLMLVHGIFLAIYLLRIHTVPYFGLPLEEQLGDTFFADGAWGRMWIFYGGFTALHLATIMWENKNALIKEAK
ncbi:MAG: cytochrome b N-terminal domain-containing protein [Candidatus Melainabacteria bacterium]|nr:cytochrome b N-terminal domain-containing protein [Candidatus Melainabacteria bacterium]